MGKGKKHRRLDTEATLCELEKHLDKHLEEYKDLVRQAAYVCRRCGRAARREDNLCKPEPL